MSLGIEKEQARALAQSLAQILSAVEERYPQPPETTQEVDYDMALLQPADGLWRVGQMGLGYEEDHDLIILIAQELVPEEDEPQEPESVRFTGTREQMQVLSEHVTWITEQGRPICPLCDNPIDPSGHFCPPSNGHNQPMQL